MLFFDAHAFHAHAANDIIRQHHDVRFSRFARVEGVTRSADITARRPFFVQGLLVCIAVVVALSGGTAALAGDNTPIPEHAPAHVTSGAVRDTTVQVMPQLSLPDAPAKISPTGGTFFGSPILLTWSAASGASSYQYCIYTASTPACDEDGPWQTTTLTSANISLTFPGTYSWQVRAVNDEGAVEADGGVWWSLVYQPDSTPPTVSHSKSEGTNTWNELAHVSATDTGSGLDPDGYGSANLFKLLRADTSAAFYTSTNLSSYRLCDWLGDTISAGMVVTASVKDRAGRVGSKAQTYKCDQSAPNIPTLSVGGASRGWWNAITLTVSSNGDNGSAGVWFLECSIDGGVWNPVCPSDVSSHPAGTTIVARARDRATNMSANSETFTILRDTQPPNVPNLILSDFAYSGAGGWNPTTLTVSGLDNGPAGIWRYECRISAGAWDVCPTDVSALPHGASVVARALDNAGNMGSSSIAVTVQRDSQPPLTPSISLGGYTGTAPWNPTTRSISTFSDPAPSAGGSVQCSVNGAAPGACPADISSLPHGVTIEAVAVGNIPGHDIAGNTVTVQRDVAQPNTPTGGATALSTGSILWQSDAGEDNGPSGFNVYLWNGVIGDQTIASHGLSANTPYTYHLQWQDAAGNTSGELMLTRWTQPVTPDVAGARAIRTWYGPQSNDDQGTGNAWRFANLVPGAFQTGTFTKYQYAFVQSEIPPMSGWSDWTAETGDTLTATASLGSGEYYLHVRSVNGENVAGLAVKTYGPYWWDETPPSMTGGFAVSTSQTFTNTPWTNQPVYLLGVPSDAHSGGTGATLTINGDQQSVYASGMDITGRLHVVSGGNLVTLTVVDDLQNTAVYTALIYYDNQPPAAFELQSPSDGAVMTDTKGMHLFTWQTNGDAVAGIREYRLVIHSDPVTYTCSVSGSCNVGPITAGLHTWDVLAVDNAGNVAGAGNGPYNLVLVQPHALTGALRSVAEQPLLAGRRITYTLTLRNDDVVPFYAVTVTDILADAVTLIEMTETPSATLGVLTPGNPLQWAIPVLGVGETATATFVVAVNPGMEGRVLMNGAVVTATNLFTPALLFEDPNPPVVQEVFDVAISQRVSSFWLDGAGGQYALTYTVALTVGTYSANLHLTDTLPAPLQVFTPSVSTDLPGNPSADNTQLVWEGHLSPRVYTLTFQATWPLATGPRVVTNTVEVSNTTGWANASAVQSVPQIYIPLIMKPATP